MNKKNKAAQATTNPRMYPMPLPAKGSPDMLTRIDLRGVMELAGKKEQVKPIVYWCSTPVRPNETLMVAGEDFAEKAVLEFAVGTKEEKWVEAKPLQASRQCLKADAGMRLVKIRIG